MESKREKAALSAEDYIHRNWNVLTKEQKDTFHRMLTRAFDFALNTIDDQRKKMNERKD